MRNLGKDLLPTISVGREITSQIFKNMIAALLGIVKFVRLKTLLFINFAKTIQ